MPGSLSTFRGRETSAAMQPFVDPALEDEVNCPGNRDYLFEQARLPARGASPRIRINKYNQGLKARSIMPCKPALKAVRLNGEGL